MGLTVLMARRKFRILAVVLALGLSGGPILGQSLRGAQASPAEARLDYTAARREIQGFEMAVNGVITETFNATPFAFTQKAKGVYLQGYGVAFTFMVNIHRAVVNTPFGQIQGVEIKPEQKRRQIELVKERLIQTILQKGDMLRQLPREEALTVVGFFEDRNFPDEESQTKTVIMSISKKDLDGPGRRDDRSTELKQRVKIVEY